MQQLIDLARQFNQPDVYEELLATMPAVVEAARLDIALRDGEDVQVKMTAYDADAYLNAAFRITPYPMRVMIVPEHEAVYLMQEPTPLVGDPLNYNIVAMKPFAPGIGMNYKDWALASWDGESDMVTIFTSLKEPSLFPVKAIVENIVARSDAAIFTADRCYIRVNTDSK